MKFCTNHSNFKVLRNNENRGPAFSRNKGLREAKGDFIAFVDIDDVWDQNKLKTQINFMIENDFNFSCTAFCIKRGNIIIPEINSREISIESLSKFTFNIACSSVIVEKIDTLRFKENLKNAEDYQLWSQLLLNPRIKPGYLENPQLLTYTLASGSQSSNKLKQLKGVFNANRTLYSFNKSILLTFYYIMNSLKRKFNYLKNSG